MKLSQFFEATGTSQRDLARTCGIHEGRLSILKQPGGWPASQEQATAILQATGGLVTPNDFLPEGVLPKRPARVYKAPAREKAPK